MLITPAQFEDDLKYIIANVPDQAERHFTADELLCEVLESLGYEAGVKAFKEIKKGYL